MFLVTHSELIKFSDFSRNLSAINILLLFFFQKFELFFLSFSFFPVTTLFHDHVGLFVYVFCSNKEDLLGNSHT